jgi:hypothetical protein
MSTSRLSSRAMLAAALVASAACAGSNPPATTPSPSADPRMDSRVGLKAGLMDAGEALSNMKVVSKAVSPEGFLGITNSDLAFTGNYVIQGNYNGPVVWDITNPAKPLLVTAFSCPASQNDVSVYKNLMFMSAEANNGRVDCLPGGVPDTVSALRFRGVRVFDISDIKKPKIVANVQTCRGSHTHTVVESPKDPDNIYIYVSGSAGVRSPNELAGCVRDTPDQNANSSLLRIEIIKVPLAHPEQSAVVNRANIFSGLTSTPTHAPGEEDLAAAAKAAAAARAAGGFTAKNPSSGQDMVLGGQFIRVMLDSVVKARGGSGAPTGADSATLRAGLQGVVNRMFGSAPQPGSPINPGASVPRHHRLSVAGPGGWRVRRTRDPDRHRRPGEPGATRCGRRLQLRLLALRHVQQRRDQDPLLRRVGRWRRAEVPVPRTRRSGGRTRSSRS